MLEIKEFSMLSVDGKPILKGLNLTVESRGDPCDHGPQWRRQIDSGQSSSRPSCL